ncbi:MAG TPA: hypothetical protein VGD14_07105 [bacterium]
MKSRLLVLIIALLFLTQLITSFALFAQSKSVTTYTEYARADTNSRKTKPITLIDIPTANILSRIDFVETGSFFNKKKVQVLIREIEFGLRLYNDGGVLGSVTAGLMEKLMFGISYGGRNLLGQGEALVNDSPGINLRYVVYPESGNTPGFALGFDSQGYGLYFSSLRRYQIKSKGVYVTASKNLDVTRDSGIGLHGGINYSLENKDNDKDLNFFCGAILRVEKNLIILWEYDFATNDNENKALGSGKGYMNAAIKAFISKRFAIEFDIKNLLKNNKTIEGVLIPALNRELKILYYEQLN